MLWEEDQRGEVSIILGVPTVRLVTFDADLDHLVEVVFVRVFPFCTFSPFYTVLFYSLEKNVTL